MAKAPEPIDLGGYRVPVCPVFQDSRRKIGALPVALRVYAADIDIGLRLAFAPHSFGDAPDVVVFFCHVLPFHRRLVAGRVNVGPDLGNLM